MRSRPAVVGVVVAVVALLTAAPLRQATGRELMDPPIQPLALTEFRIGVLARNTFRLCAVGGKEATDIRRWDSLLFVFSDPIDYESVSAETVQVGVTGEDGIFTPAKGGIYRYANYERDETFPWEEWYLLDRVLPNCLVFEPTAEWEPPDFRNPDGFDPETTYEVVLPGTDSGATTTLRTPNGRRLERTFRTTFRTGPDVFRWGDRPALEMVESTDAPGFPVEPWRPVDLHAEVVLRFTEPVLTATLDPRRTFRVRDLTTLRYVRVPVRPAPDRQTYVLRPPRRGWPERRVLQIEADHDAVVDRSGIRLEVRLRAGFATGPAP